MTRPSIRTAPTPYDARTIAFHWFTVILVAAQWLGALAIDWFPRGALRTDARSTHIIIGLLLTALIVARLAWRATAGRRLPYADTGPLKALASIVHTLLYILLASTVLLGISNALLRGDSIFGLFSLPKPAWGSAGLKSTVETLHALSANSILWVAGLHAAAALWHQYFRRDGVLGRMIPGLPS